MENLEIRTCKLGECPDAKFALHVTGLRCSYNGMNVPVEENAVCRYSLVKEQVKSAIDEDYMFENGTRPNFSKD